MSVPRPIAGALPLGRWPATMTEIEAAYVHGQSAKRQKIWDDWIQLNAALKEAVVHVAAVWLSARAGASQRARGCAA